MGISFDENVEGMLTGMANSLGIIEKNHYNLINEEGTTSGMYTRGYGAVFPYVNIKEPLPVIESSEIFMNGNQIDNFKYSYYNAVIHRQGLGFCGFERIISYNKKGQTLAKTYEPYRYSLLKSEVSPEYEKSYTYSVNQQLNKIVKIRLTNKTEKDLLKGNSAITTYNYDTYGYPTEENTSYSGNINIKKENKYAAKTTVEDGYNLGFLTDQKITVTREGSSYSERMYIPAYSSRLPNTKIFYKDGNQVKQYTYTYDNYGNPITETIKLYTSSNSQKTSYEYDSRGRLSKVTSPLGLTNEYSYDSSGRIANIKDHKGGYTSFTYDAFGREVSVNYPDKTSKTFKYSWSSEGVNGLYAITISNTGKPTTTEIYDGLNREIRKSEITYNGVVRSIDKLYDNYGNLQKISLPFIGSTASAWNTYTYDNHDRILSYTEYSGRKSTYSYNGNNITTVENNISTTKEYDALDNVISVQDPAGTITYKLAADGQPISIMCPGNITTLFSYDKYRRCISLTDPSQGETTYEYDVAGNVAKETNSNGEVTQNEYDSYNRLIKTTTPEFVTSFTYNSKDELTSISTNNGTSKSFVYDNYGRLTTWKENCTDGKWLQKDYTYSNGNISSIKYTSQSGVLATENYIYSNGHLNEARLDGTTVFKLTKENSFGQPTEIVTGGITHKYDFTAYGLPSGRSASGTSKTYQNFSYVFDAATSNLTSRKDNTRNITENFGYDNLNRLTSFANRNVAYDVKGNIISKSDVGTLEYSLAQKPYAVSGINLTENGIPTGTQEITYTSFVRPKSIAENGYVATFTYNGEYDRVKMNISQNGSSILTRYYLGNCYELDQTSSSSKEKLYLFSDFYGASAVYIKDGSSENIYYILRDYLGSITHIVDSNGTLVQELSYDAWGRLRNPVTQQLYEPGKEPVLFLGRGYTGHEHLAQFGLINMNARLYDPVLGRFLSPDPFVQASDMSQNFNRYAYALNNPLCYVDKNGEFWWIIIGAAIGGVVNLVNKAIAGQLHSFGDGFAAFGIGAVAGGLGVAAGAYAFTVAGGAAGGIGGFLAGAASGAIGTAAAMPFQSAGNHMYFKDSFMSLKTYIISITIGAFTGGVTNGTIAAFNNKNFWTGDKILDGRSVFSFKNTPSNNSSSTVEINYVETNSSSTQNSTSATSADIQKPQKPIQEHHFASNKNKTFTPEFKKITDKYNLDLNGSWNKEKLPHIGRHPNEYHNWVLEQMKTIDAMPNMNQQNFINQFNIRIIQPIRNNPDILYKDYWLNHY